MEENTLGDISNFNDTREATNSTEITKNSKGYTWKIKIYDNDLEAMKEKVANMEKWCKERYGGEQ